MAVAHKEISQNLWLTPGKREKQKMLCKRFADCMAFFLFKIVNVSFSVFQRNAQPLPPAMISGVWGYVTNKHLAGIPGTGFLLNTQSYVRLHCLPVTWMKLNKSIFELTFYIQVVIDQCFCGIIPQTGLKWNNPLFGQPVLLSVLCMPADILPGSYASAEHTL